MMHAKDVSNLHVPYLPLVSCSLCAACRLLHAAGNALLHPATQPYAPLWLSLVQQALGLSPQHAGTAALVLPLRINASAADSPPAEQRVAPGSSRQALLEAWRQVAHWLAAPDTRGGRETVLSRGGPVALAVHISWTYHRASPCSITAMTRFMLCPADAVQQQLLALQPSLKPPGRQQRSQASGARALRHAAPHSQPVPTADGLVSC